MSETMNAEKMRGLADSIHPPLNEIECNRIAAALRWAADVVDAANEVVEESRRIAEQSHAG